MSETKRNVPKLRFPGFTEDWEQRKFSEITVNIGKRNKENLNLEPYAITKDDGFIPQAEAHDEFGYMKETDRKAYNIVKPNSFGYNPARINVGSIGYYSGSEDIIVSSLYEIFQTSENIYDRFLWHWFKSKQFQNWIERLQEGSVRLYFYYDKLCECEIFIPTVDEQIKIGNSLDRLDKLITLHQRKLENLKLKKKALLQKLFPKNGEQFPELRFPGFTDAWEQRKSEDIFISITDKGHSGLPVLSASQEWGMIRRDEGGIDIQHDKANENTYKRVLPGQFVIHLRSFQGGFAYSEIEGITSPAYTVIDFKNQSEHYPLFWKHVFKSSVFIKRLETITYGIRDGRSISFSDFKTLSFRYPTLDEQKNIADSIEVFEKYITLHQRKLEHLQLQKKALLQQMFV